MLCSCDCGRKFKKFCHSVMSDSLRTISLTHSLTNIIIGQNTKIKTSCSRARGSMGPGVLPLILPLGNYHNAILVHADNQ